MITATFTPGNLSYRTAPLQQHDHGQELEIRGLVLPPAVEIHFATSQQTEAIIRIGTTIAGITTVQIPDNLLKQGLGIMAYIYLTTPTSGRTMYTIHIHVQPRSEPENLDVPENEDLFHETVAAVNNAANRAEDAKDQAGEYAEAASESAKAAADAVEEIPGQVEDAKADIDRYVSGKEAELKGDTGNVYFASFKVVGGRLKMYSDPTVTKVVFRRKRSRLSFKVTGGSNG